MVLLHILPFHTTTIWRGGVVCGVWWCFYCHNTTLATNDPVCFSEGDLGRVLGQMIAHEEGRVSVAILETCWVFQVFFHPVISPREQNSLAKISQQISVEMVKKFQSCNADSCNLVCVASAACPVPVLAASQDVSCKQLVLFPSNLLATCNLGDTDRHFRFESGIVCLSVKVLLDY